jgi:hypothetical protein
MENLQSRWSAAQIVICAGIVCVVVGFVGNVVGVVYAQSCASVKVRASSPCITSASACRETIPGECTTEGTKVYMGDFQCDTPNSGTTCSGTGSLYACFDRGSCYYDTNASDCRIDPVGVYGENAETQKTVDCAS